MGFCFIAPTRAEPTHYGTHQVIGHQRIGVERNYPSPRAPAPAKSIRKYKKSAETNGLHESGSRTKEQWPAVKSRFGIWSNGMDHATRLRGFNAAAAAAATRPGACLNPTNITRGDSPWSSRYLEIIYYQQVPVNYKPADN